MNHKTAVFLIGLGTGIVVMLGGLFLYARLGFVDPRADIPVSSIEETVAMSSLDASLDRRAPGEKNPVPGNEAELAAGMKLYQSHCADCHGDVNHPKSSMAESLYPRAPQFMHDEPDMPGNQNFYLIKHGIRYSGMPAWDRTITDREIWQVVGFLATMNKLPASVQEQWKAEAK